MEFVTDLESLPAYVTVGRGFTLDDPDVWANLTLVLGAGYYLQYNAIVYLDPSQVGEGRGGRVAVPS